jgi:SOS-response transcriptional repressor LexA
MARDETGRAKARKQKLEEAIKIAGSAAKLSKLCGISASEISQMRNPDHPRNVGDVAAEKIEVALSLPHGWMDRLHDEQQSQASFHNPSIDPFPALLAEMPITHRRKIPVISYVQAGNWCTLVDNFAPGDADEWVETTGKYSETTYALRVNGTSMQPTINENAIIIVDPQAEWGHNKIVVVRQNGDDEVTVKRLIKDGGTWLLKPDNDRFPIMTMKEDAHVCGVVVEMMVKFL